MKKNMIFMVVAFTVIWVVLTERVTLLSVGAGVLVSVACVFFCHKFLPLEKISGISYFRFALYVIMLIGQMYIGAFSAIKLILKGAKADVVEIRTDITNDFLRVMLANSITLVPGSITLEMVDDKITVLLLHKKTDGLLELSDSTERIKGRLEEKLLRAQK